MKMHLVLLFFIQLILVSCAKFKFHSDEINLFKGDKCRNNNPNGGAKGRCVPAYECSWAVQQIHQHQKIDICCFERKTPIVCCPLNRIKDNDNVTQPPMKPKPADQTTPKTDDRGPEEIQETPVNLNPGPISASVSQQKCDEYYPRPEGFTTVAFGGEETLAEEFPHMAVLGYGTDSEKQWKCGGSLITLQHVLTAAHCLSSRDLGDVRYVRLGDLDIEDDNDKAEPQDFTVKTITPHPDFDSSTIKNDIAILELDRPVKLTNYVKPACLFFREESDLTNEITATGWGITEFAGKPSSHLLKVRLKITENSECRKQYSKNKNIGSIDVASQVCAQSADEDKRMDTCQGDSGGPLQMINYTYTRHYHVIGITSFGKACGITDSAGIYTRVSNYIPWIDSIIY